MSAATTVIGLMPLLLTQGRGSDAMQPMAVPSVGGMPVQVVAFLDAPCLYCLVQMWKLGRGESASLSANERPPNVGRS